MSWTPTDEQVEKAAEAIREDGLWDLHHWSRVRIARAVLVAVGPMIAAQALRDYADTFQHPTGGRATDARERADQIEKEAGR